LDRNKKKEINNIDNKMSNKNRNYLKKKVANNHYASFSN